MSEADQIHFERINEAVQQHMHHPFLADNQIRQSASRFHFGVARAILQAAKMPLEETRVILEAVLLLQQGLSIHDDVDGHPERTRQLIVLAGDYDSSQYYALLARAGQIQLISVLSDAVSRINESKMTLFQHSTQLTPDRYVELREVVEGELLIALARHCLGSSRSVTNEIRSVIRAYVANEDLQAARTPRHITFRQAYDWLSDAIEHVVSPANALLEPITAFVEDYFVPIRNDLETHTSVEGNRG